ncbi:MAG TPA: hypothetical protein VGO07_01960, partial [Candidatus Saccharimonadales bacterium]|nr:hypothetical protein [Candidatus Saccharimonadales bacterium]
TGHYNFHAAVALSGVTTACTAARISLITSNRTYSKAFGVSSPPAGMELNIAVLGADMDAGDTAFIQIQVDGMAGDTVDTNGNPSYCWFSGHQI